MFVKLFILNINFILTTFPTKILANIHSRWNNDIFCGRHFDDLITESNIPSSRVIIPAILVMYTPYCESVLDTHGLNEELGLIPAHQFMVIAKYDYVTSPKHIWYKLDARDDLVHRYNPKMCLEYLYFAPGARLDIYQPHRYDGVYLRDHIQSWIWNKLQVVFHIYNSRQERLIVTFYGRGPQLSSLYVSPGKEVVITSYISYILMVYDVETWQFLHAVELTAKSAVNINFTSESHGMRINGNDWLSTALQLQKVQDTKLKEWRWNLAVIYLHNFKHPVLLPKFTNTGYVKGVIPRDLYEELLNFYLKNIHRRRSEYGAERTLPFLNYDKVDTAILQLPQDMVNKTSHIMQPFLEEWVGQSLLMTSLYGIREYHRGNVLRSHVDRITTHVVSVILQIYQRTVESTDWELEIIGYDGIRRNITLQAGEMLCYESTTLVHGRPYPFQGSAFANVFLHYKPVNGWHWDVSEGYHDMTYKGEVVESYETFVTVNTREKAINKEKFVVWGDSVHGEL